MAGKPDYGIDAPGVIRNLFIAGALFLVVALVFPKVTIGSVTFLLTPGFFWPAGWFFLTGILMLIYALAGKFRHRERMLAKVAWNGSEQVLDVGTGRGLLLIGAAKRLTSDPRVVSLEPSSLDDVLANIEFVGELTGHVSGARALVEALSLRIEAMRGAKATRRPRTLVLEWTDPPMGPGHWTPGLVELAGGTAILSNPGANSQRLEWEAIVQADPDAIIVAPCGFGLERARAAVDELAAIPQWSSLRAHRENRVHVVDGNAYVNRPGPRLVDTAEIFARLL